eukprot:1530-Heterococcus_DN1.PRE.2
MSATARGIMPSLCEPAATSKALPMLNVFPAADEYVIDDIKKAKFMQHVRVSIKRSLIALCEHSMRQHKIASSQQLFRV